MFPPTLTKTKFHPYFLIKISLIFVLTLIFAMTLRFLLSNFDRSRRINHQLISQSVTSLNLSQLQQAVDLINSFSESYLTTNFSSVSVNSEVVFPTETTQKAETGVTITIQNASGINNAASVLANQLKDQGFTNITLSTAPSNQNQTSLLYKQSHLNLANQIRTIIENKGWPVANFTTKPDQETADITIILGSE